MKRIALSGKNGIGKYALVDDEDYDNLITHKWAVSNMGYATRLVYSKEKSGVKRQLMHRLIMDSPTNLQIDHIDNNTLNNQKSNLRPSTQAQNCWNRKISSSNTSGYKGVTFIKRIDRWQADIYHNYRRYRLGSYLTKEEAAQAYNTKAKELFGEFALLNGITLTPTTNTTRTAV